jgi:hypothetical protein
MTYTKDFALGDAARRIKEKRRKYEAACENRRKAAQKFAKDLAQKLGRSDDRVRKIVGFGSTFELWRSYRLDSDIDLGIIGGDWSFLMGQIPVSEFKVSLVELELQNAEFRDYVLKKGEVLYEKS